MTSTLSNYSLEDFPVPVLGVFTLEDGDYKTDGKEICINVKDVTCIKPTKKYIGAGTISRDCSLIEIQRESYFVKEVPSECKKIIMNAWKESLELIEKLNINIINDRDL